jgi:hypothetical protein
MQTTRIPLLTPLCALALCCFLSGCGGSEKPVGDGGPPRIPVSGKITYDGKPIDGGTIAFDPKAEGLRPTGGPIVNGEYNVPLEKGGNAGPYLIKISWPQPTGKKFKDDDTGEMMDEMKEAIPKKYNEASTLEVTLSEEDHVFDYDLAK